MTSPFMRKQRRCQTSYGKEDSSLYAKYFNGSPTGVSEECCWYCQTQDHSAAMCPSQERKQKDTKAALDKLCKKYNYNDGRCTVLGIPTNAQPVGGHICSHVAIGFKVPIGK